MDSEGRPPLDILRSRGQLQLWWSWRAEGGGVLGSGVFAGTPASMCSVLGTVIQGLLMCSEWLCLRGGQDLCNTFIHLINQFNAGMLLFPVKKKTTTHNWLMPSSNISGLFAFIFYHFAIHLSGLGQSIGTWVLDFLCIEWGACRRSSFNSMHYFYYNYFLLLQAIMRIPLAYRGHKI